MSTRKHLTGLDVTRHEYGDPPLLDEGCPGLRLCALKPLKDGTKRGSWIYRYRTKAGVLKQIKLGQYPGMGLADAKAAWGKQKKIRDDPSLGDPRTDEPRRLLEKKVIPTPGSKAAGEVIRKDVHELVCTAGRDCCNGVAICGQGSRCLASADE